MFVLFVACGQYEHQPVGHENLFPNCVSQKCNDNHEIVVCCLFMFFSFLEWNVRSIFRSGMFARELLDQFIKIRELVNMYQLKISTHQMCEVVQCFSSAQDLYNS